MRKIEDDLGCRKRNSTNASKKTLEAPLVNKYRVILTFFIIGCLATILIAGVKDVYGAAGVSISPPRVDYGPVGVGSWEDQTITITNTGKLSFTVLEVPKWAPPDRPWLSLVADSCSNQELSSQGGFCSIAYRFSPDAVGDYDYQLNIRYTYDLKTVNNVNIHIEGTGIKGTPNITWSNPAPITYGTALGPTQLNATASIPGSFTYTPPAGTFLNAGNNQPLSVTFTPTDTVNYNTATKTVSINVLKATAQVTLANLTPTYTGTPLTPTVTTIPAGLPIVWTGVPQTNAGTYSVTATVNDLNYQGSASSTFIINKAPVTIITLGDLTTQTYTGSPLTPTVTTNPPNLGITWTGAPQTNAGTYSVTATVNDPNYLGSASGTFIIKQATPTITWSNPADITYGTALNGIQLNATASVPGAFEYTPEAGAVLSVGSQTLSVAFTPTDQTNYGSATKSVVINVLPAAPIITWNNPADITHPTPLTEIQLNATASFGGESVQGTFAYNPDYCVELPPGTHTLSVTFTPPPGSNYGTATATVQINVLAPIVTKEKVYDSWVCTQRDAATGFPLAMYLCINPDGSEPECSNCMTAGNRCGDLSPSDDEFTFDGGDLRWVGPTNETVDFVTTSIIYRCIEYTDFCFSCGGNLPWSCRIPNLLNPLTATTRMRQKIGNVWACSESPDPVSGCFTTVYTCLNATDENPCNCTGDNRLDWARSTFEDVSFGQGELKSVGPGSDDPICETVYFVTSKIVDSAPMLCTYKCISDPSNCIPSGDPDNPYCCFSYCSPE